MDILMVDNLETMDLNRVGPQEGPTFSYTLTYEQIMRCLREAFNRTGKKGKLIQTWVLGFLSVIYLSSFFGAPQLSTYLFLGLLPVALIVFIWLAPFLQRRKIAREMSQGNVQYQVTLYARGVIIRYDGAEYVFMFSDAIEIFEDDEQFALQSTKDRLYAIPKSSMNAETLRFAHRLFPEKLGGRYHDGRRKTKDE